MNILVFHPELGMGVTDESYQFTPASKADPETYKQLLSKGEVLSDVFHGRDMCSMEHLKFRSGL